MDLFDFADQQQSHETMPLAARMRPRTLDEYVGQDHILGKGKLLRRAIEADKLFSSIILYGPPGTGKTTLAQLIAARSHAQFESISAVLAGVAELRKVITEAQERRRLYRQRTLLFIDEVHRWNKAQQDALLPHVENGLITLIGATTENPYFEVIRALISRSRIFELKPLDETALQQIFERAMTNREHGYGGQPITVTDDARRLLIDLAGGDARNLLNGLELAIETTPFDMQGKKEITLEIAEESIQQRALQYDKGGDAHYDTISAFIKSIRGSDPDAALYWGAKMLLSGEDPRFILRRLVVLASEDIGLADSHGLEVVTAAVAAYEFIGMPEGYYPIAHAILYLATAPKSNSVGAIFKALEKVREEGAGAVPIHLMDSSRDAKGLGHGIGYQYPHSFPNHYVKQQYLPEGVDVQFYQPSEQGDEKAIKRWLTWLKGQDEISAPQN